jgi:hypothetical protein
MALFDARLALEAFERFVKETKLGKIRMPENLLNEFNFDETRVRVIREKLKKEAQIRDWDHVFYVLSEDYLDEQGIEAILPPKLEEYIVRFT